MSADNFTGQLISSTFQRLLQLSNNGNYITDGTGSVVTFLPINVNNALTASYVQGISSFNTSSFLINAEVSLNTITFTKGDYSQFSITIDTGSNSGGGSETDPIFVSKSGSLATTGSNTFIGDQIITGSVYISGSFGLNVNFIDPIDPPDKTGLLYFTNTAAYISLDY